MANQSEADSSATPNDGDVLLAGTYRKEASAMKTFLIFLAFHFLYLLCPAFFMYAPFIILVVTTNQTVKLVTALLLIMYWSNVMLSTSHKTHGAPWKWFENGPLVRFVLEWLPVRILRTCKLDSSKRYVFACHPHGVLAFNRAAVGFSTNTLWDQAFPGVSFRVLVASAAFYVPVIRELWLWTYCVDASKATAVKVLRDLKNSVFVYPGGEREQILTLYQRERVFLSSRKGFVKLAMEEGVDLIPVYSFGESHLYKHSSYLLDLRLSIAKKFGVAIPFLSGQYGLMPYRVPITMVFGAPVKVPHITKPTAEELDAAHRVYCDALMGLFEKHKAAMGYPDAKLEVL